MVTEINIISCLAYETVEVDWIMGGDSVSLGAACGSWETVRGLSVLPVKTRYNPEVLSLRVPCGFLIHTYLARLLCWPANKFCLLFQSDASTYV